MACAKSIAETNLESRFAKISGSLECGRLNHVFVAYSGGLDSVLCVALARRVYKAARVTVAIGDIGQGKALIDTALRRLKPLEVDDILVLDLRDEFFGRWLTRAIRANASYRGYPIAAPMVKQLLGRCLGKEAVARGCDAFFEGSSGLGNDQFRFAAALSAFASEIRHIGPLRDLSLSRVEEIALCDHWGLEYDKRLAMGGDDVTPWCRSIASGGIGLEDQIDPSWLMWVVPGAKGNEEVEITFESGIPVALNGESLDLETLLERLNKPLGRCGLGLIDIIEDNRLGQKGREIYEAPAATAILAAKADLESLCLTREELDALAQWQRSWLQLIYDGRAFHPLVEALDAAIAVCQQRVSGTIGIEVCGGALRVLGRRAENGLLESPARLTRSSQSLVRAARVCLEMERTIFKDLAARVRS